MTKLKNKNNKSEDFIKNLESNINYFVYLAMEVVINLINFNF
ncbi:MAG: hypothetical protein RR067_05965 [Bacilli bacterium]